MALVQADRGKRGAPKLGGRRGGMTRPPAKGVSKSGRRGGYTRP